MRGEEEAEDEAATTEGDDEGGEVTAGVLECVGGGVERDNNASAALMSVSPRTAEYIAKCRGVHIDSKSDRYGDAPPFSKRATHFACPLLAAHMSGVRPMSSRTSTSAGHSLTKSDRKPSSPFAAASHTLLEYIFPLFISKTHYSSPAVVQSTLFTPHPFFFFPSRLILSPLLLAVKRIGRKGEGLPSQLTHQRGMHNGEEANAQV
mmetsp:Transcript_42338/g.108965  ORF Transcript_42338/g.108965 Transcript_42338/m.108965 type:complete len:206 (-) Transcript_42338:147-764(-)